MFKAKAILFLVKTLMWIALIGIGFWYLSSSLNGTSLTYTSVDRFLIAAGVENGDISTANGCFLCKYVSDLFAVLGNATDKFWNAMLHALWILIVVGFGIFLVFHAIKHIYEAAKTTTKLSTTEKKLEFKAWFDKVWKQAIRVMIVGFTIGALGMGGTSALKTITNITIRPVMFLGAELSMAATGVNEASQCSINVQSNNAEDILNPVLKPFMCVVGNINAVVLAGAAGGFTLMNYSWLGLGGGLFTWLAGFGLVLMFMYIGFDLFFQILSVIFKLVFIIIFMPLLLAAYAFEGVWSAANGLVNKSIDMLVSSAVRMVAITLKTLIIYATVSYSADMYFPPKQDGYTAILPPLMGQTVQNPDSQTMSVMNVFSTCEQVALVNDEVDKEKFINCFMTKKAEVEQVHQNAFDFLGNSWDFLVLMAAIFFLYYYAISPKIDKMLGKDGDEIFDYGTWIKDLGKQAWKLPVTITEKITSKIGK
ncbi:MAG: hypothetical protein ACLRFK_03815 [Alphaproteobacteria bacterium]